MVVSRLFWPISANPIISQGERGISAHISFFKSLITESLILAQDERWRRASYMQVERESILRGASTVAHG